MKTTRRLFSLALGACVSALLSGCTLENTASPGLEQGAALQGGVHGGNQPVVGAKVFLLQANTTGYGGVGIAAASTNASKSLLTIGTVDVSTGATNGLRYVTTDANGSFSITGDYTCTSGSQVYLYVLGGNTGAGTNSASGFLSVLGTCPSSGSFLGTVPYVWINEVTTVAAAYALAGFASDALHVSNSGTALANTGMANAFANFSTLANVANGTAYAVNPHNSSGTVPQSELNTLANILAACVNTSDAVPGNCNNLFSYVRSNGATGTTAIDTATEAFYIAQHPGIAVSSLFGLQTASSPFQPTLSQAPNDFTVGIVHHNNGVIEPIGIAIDAKGNAWIADGDTYDGPNGLSGFTNLGAVAANSPVAADSTNHFFFPQGLAIDQSGFIWVINQSYNGSPNPYLSKLTGAGVDVASYSGNSMYISNGIAIDPSGGVIVANTGSGSNSNISRFTSAGAAASNSPIVLTNSVGATGLAVAASGYVYPADGDFNGNDSNVHRFLYTASGSTPAIATSSSTLYLDAVDASGNVWIADGSGRRVIEVNSNGAAVTGSPFATSLSPYAVAIDGNSNIWLSGASPFVAELSPAGAQISPTSYGYGKAALNSTAEMLSMAIDGCGDVWLADYNNNNVVELIGAAVPVVTPIAANLVSPYGTASVNKP